MSVINKDSEVVNEGRTNKLEDVDAPLRDQIPAKLKTKLEEIEAVERVRQIWSIGDGHRAAWISRQEKFLGDWDEFLEVEDSGAFEEASSLHLPMPFIVAKTYHARMLEAILGQDPAFSVKARRADSVERASMVQELMKYTLKSWANNNRGIDEVIDRWVWEWITEGSAVLKYRWDVTYSKYVDVEPEARTGPPKFIQNEETGERDVVPTTVMEDVEVEKVEKTFEGPCVENVSLEDLVIVGGEGSIEDADAVIHRQYLTASELHALADRKIFEEKAVESIIESGPTSRDGEANSLKSKRVANGGEAAVESDANLDVYEVLEAHIKIDVDGSGINSDVIIWCSRTCEDILRATYARRVEATGKRPFIKVDFFERKQSTYGMGLIEVLHPLTTELDAMHNMRIDYGLLSTMPFGFYRASSNIDPTQLQLEPGMLIPVDDPQRDVHFPQLGNRSVFAAQEEQSLQTMVEKLTGISDLSLGVMSGSQGATRTATGARALQQEANSNLNVHLRRLNKGWSKLLEALYHLTAQRMPDGLEFRITGDNGQEYFKNVMREDIAGDFDFEISANSATSNPAVREQVAQQVLQLASNPLDLQLGIVTPAERFEAVKNTMVAMGVKDYAKFIKKPEGHQAGTSPEEEANRILRGEAVPVTPQSDHEGFIAFWEIIKKDDQLLGQFTPQASVAMERQAREHSAMLAALQQQQSSQNQIQQNQVNSSEAGPTPEPDVNNEGGRPVEA